MSSNNKTRSLVAPGQLIAALVYAALIYVVYYGIDHYVYDGFPKAVPFVIMVIFAVMSMVRLIGFFRSVKAQIGVSRYNKTRADLDLSKPDGVDDYGIR